MSSRSQFPASLLRQKAVLWRSPTDDGYGGKTFAAPVEINVRWEGKAEMVRNPQGREVMSRAIAYAVSSVSPGDYVMLGLLASLTHPTDQPNGYAAAYMVLAVQDSMDVSVKKTVRKIWL